MSTPTRILAGVAAVVAVVVVAALWQAGPLAGWALPRIAAWYGVAPLRLHVADIGWSGAVLENVSLGDEATPDVAAARIAIDAPWAVIRQGRVDSIRIDGLHMRARWADGKLSLGTLDPLLGQQATEGQASGDLPFATVVVRDGEASLSTPWGPVEALFDAGIRAQDAGGLQANADAVLRHDSGWLRAGAVVIQDAQGALSLTLDLAEAEAAVTGLAVRLGGGTLRAELSSAGPPAGTLDLAVDRLAVAGRSFTGLVLEGAIGGTALRMALSGGAVVPGLSLSAQAAVSDVTADDGAVSFEARLQLGDLARDPAGGALPWDAMIGGDVGLRLETTVAALSAAARGEGAGVRPSADLDLVVQADTTPYGPVRSTIAGSLTAEYGGARLRLATADDLDFSVTATPPGLDAPVTLTLSAPPGSAQPLAIDVDLDHGVADVIADAAFRLSAADQGAVSGVLSGNAALGLAPLELRQWHVVDLALDGGPVTVAGHRLAVTAARLSGSGTAAALEARGHLAATYYGAPVPGLTINAGTLDFDGHMAWDDAILSVRPNDCLALTAAAVDWTPAGLDTGPLALCLESAEGPLLTWQPDAPPDGRAALSGTARLTAPATLRVRQASGKTADSLRLTRLSLDAIGMESDLAGRIDLAADRIVVDRPPLRIGGGAVAVAGPYRWSDGTVSLTPDGCLALGAKELSVPGFSLTAPLDLCLKTRSPPMVAATVGAQPALHLSTVLAPAKIDAQVGQGDGAVAAGGTLPSVDLVADWRGAAAPWSVEAGVAGGDLTVGGRWNLADAKARLTATGVATVDDGALHLDGLALADQAPAPMVAPLSLSGTAFVVERSARFDAKVTDSSGLLSLAAQGRHDLTAGTGEATFGMPTLNFDAGRQPQQLLPFLRGIVTSVRGSLDLSGDAAWGDGDLSSSLAVSLNGGAVSTKVAELSGVSASTRFDSLWPPSTPPGQTLSIANADVGIPLEDIQVSFRVLPQGAVLVERAASPWMGGTILAAGVTLDPAANRHAMVLEVSDVLITRLLDFIDLDDLAGNGRLSGRIPVEVVDGTPYIRNGRLASEDGGALSYTSDGVDAALRGGGQGGSLLADALKDFRYKSLVMELDGQTTGEVTARVLLAGSNPDLYDGYPIELNTTFEGNLGQIMRGARATYGISDSIRERLENSP